MSKPKTANTKSKPNSMQVVPVPANHVSDGGWVVSPSSSVLGTELLKQLKRAVRDHELLQEHNCTKRSDIAFDAAYSIARILALVPPRGPEEALAAAAMLYDEAGDMDQADGWTKGRCEEWSLRMRQRASALASWIETTKMKRNDRVRYLTSKTAIETVEVPSLRIAMRIASARNTSSKDRVEYARTLVNDAKTRASASLRKPLTVK